eukprot:922262-Pelagomonas_calceolata.AAC.1
MNSASENLTGSLSVFWGAGAAGVGGWGRGVKRRDIGDGVASGSARMGPLSGRTAHNRLGVWHITHKHTHIYTRERTHTHAHTHAHTHIYAQQWGRGRL